MRDSASLIERWLNAARVLEAMPEHDREHHWNMATWGEKTDCGTVACAAGHCGLDPWFRERGFKLVFRRNGDSDISDVEAFFGFEGAKRIFFNASPRPVETVLGEVRAYISELRTIETLSADLKLPAIGAAWPDQGGHFAGLRLRSDGEPYALIVGPECDDQKNWADANAWAAGLTVGEHHDFVLPDRHEAITLFDRVQSLFQPSWYWLSEQHESGAGYAWYQGFGDGGQTCWLKFNALRVRAVRRFPIR